MKETSFSKIICGKFDNNIYNVILDVRHYKETFEILDILKSLNLKYLLVSPHFLDPKNKRYSYEENISKNLYSLFYMCVNKDIFYYTNKKEIKLLETVFAFNSSAWRSVYLFSLIKYLFKVGES